MKLIVKNVERGSYANGQKYVVVEGLKLAEPDVRYAVACEEVSDLYKSFQKEESFEQKVVIANNALIAYSVLEEDGVRVCDETVCEILGTESYTFDIDWEDLDDEDVCEEIVDTVEGIDEWAWDNDTCMSEAYWGVEAWWTDPYFLCSEMLEALGYKGCLEGLTSEFIEDTYNLDQYLNEEVEEYNGMLKGVTRELVVA